VRELARRQDELLRKQEELARNRQNMSEEELKRELEKLTREQSELRQRAEELARQVEKQQQGSQGSQSSQSSQGSQGSQGSQKSSQGSQQGGQNGKQLQDASEAMRNATNDLRRQDPKQATASGARALERLREIERQMQSGRPDERRRAMGDMQLEARQLADAQRQVAGELGKTASGEAGKDAVRRLAGEPERLAERAGRLQDSIGRQAAGSQTGKEIERQRLADRMQQSAEAMRSAADRGAGTQRGNTAQSGSSPAVDDARRQIGAQQEIARALDKVADD